MMLATLGTSPNVLSFPTIFCTATKSNYCISQCIKHEEIYASLPFINESLLEKSISFFNKETTKKASHFRRNSLQAAKSDLNIGKIGDFESSNLNRRWQSEKKIENKTFHKSHTELKSHELDQNEDSEKIPIQDTQYLRDSKGFSRIAFKKKTSFSSEPSPKTDTESDSESEVELDANKYSHFKVNEKYRNGYLDSSFDSSFDDDNDATRAFHFINGFLLNSDEENAGMIKGECKICFDKKYLTVTKCCRFEACSDCLNFYIKIQIENRNLAKIECLNTNCKKLIAHYEITQRMTNYNTETLKKYLKDVLDSKSLKNSNFKTCPRCSLVTKLKSKNIFETIKKPISWKKD
jgi:hypothetical protein